MLLNMLMVISRSQLNNSSFSIYISYLPTFIQLYLLLSNMSLDSGCYFEISTKVTKQLFSIFFDVLLNAIQIPIGSVSSRCLVHGLYVTLDDNFGSCMCMRFSVCSYISAFSNSSGGKSKRRHQSFRGF